jgi:hypothetical protein
MVFRAGGKRESHTYKDEQLLFEPDVEVVYPFAVNGVSGVK